MESKAKEFHKKVNKAYRDVYGTKEESMDDLPKDVDAILKINSFAMIGEAVNKIIEDMVDEDDEREES